MRRWCTVKYTHFALLLQFPCNYELQTLFTMKLKILRNASVCSNNTPCECNRIELRWSGTDNFYLDRDLEHKMNRSDEFFRFSWIWRNSYILKDCRLCHFASKLFIIRLVLDVVWHVFIMYYVCMDIKGVKRHSFTASMTELKTTNVNVITTGSTEFRFADNITHAHTERPCPHMYAVWRVDNTIIAQPSIIVNVFESCKTANSQVNGILTYLMTDRLVLSILLVGLYTRSHTFHWLWHFTSV